MRARIVLTLAVLAATGAWAQLPPSPAAPEAPETLLNLAIGDADVSFFGSGSWTTGIAPALGWRVTRGASGVEWTAGYLYPGLEPLPFFNRVDLTLSLWLLERYFFEATIGDDIAASVFLFGYVGRPGESVQSIVVGNAGIGIGAYPYLGFGDETGVVGQDAPGASALFATDASEHEILLRFAPSAEDVIRYAGGAIVEESVLEAGDYERGRHYVLPDGSLDFLELYLESPDGDVRSSDGRRFRRVDLSRESVFSLADGTVSLANPPESSLLVYYERGGVPIGDDSLGEASYYGLDSTGRPDRTQPRDFSFSALGDYLELLGFGTVPAGIDASDLLVTLYPGTSDERTAFLLAEPGRYAPFASAAFYPLGDVEPNTALIETAGGAPAGGQLDVRILPERRILRVGASGGDVRSFAARYPLASELAGTAYPELYGPDPDAPPDAPRIVLRRSRPSDSIVLPSGFIPGSVRVVRNGATELAFIVSDAGEIEFDEPLGPTDSVTVRYRTAATGEASDLLFASGNRFFIGAHTEATLAFGARLKPLAGTFATRAGDYPGAVTLSGSVESTLGAWSLATRGAMSVATSNTTGALRVAGMGEAGVTLPVSPPGLFPAPPPRADPDPSDAIPLSAFAAARRGTLRYVDYYTGGILGGRELLAYNDDSGLAAPIDYDVAGRAGPYPARSFDDAYSGTVAVFDFEIGEGRDWAGGIVRIDGGRGTDLSDTTTLAVPYRLLSSDAPVRLVLEIGAIGEDLDADGVLDEGADGLPFTDVAAGITLDAGTVPVDERGYSEDADGNGVLDRELSDLVVSLPFSETFGPVTSGGEWRTALFELSPAHSAALTESRAIRLLILRDGAGPVTGRLILGAVEALGSGFTVGYEPQPGRLVVARERPAASYPGELLEDAFPEVASRFSDGREQRLLSVAWSGLDDQTITLARATEVPAADYREARLYHRLAGTGDSPATLTVRLSGEDGTLAESQGIIADDEWDVIVVPIPADASGIVRRIDVLLSGPDASEVLLDELSFREPRSRVGAIGEVTARFAPDASLTAGGLMLVDEIVVAQRLTAQSETFPDDIGATRAGVESVSEVSARVFGARTELGLDLLVNQSGTGLQARHSIDLPVTPLAMRVSDEFRVAYGLLGPARAHATSLSVAPGERTLLSLDWSHEVVDERETAWTLTARRGDLAPDPSGAEVESLTLDLEAVFGMRDVSDAVAAAEPYPVSWVSDFAAFAPAGSPRERALVFSGAAELGGAPVGLRLETEAGASTNERRIASLTTRAAVPLRVGRAGTVEIELGRTSEIGQIAEPAETPLDDLAAAGALVAAHPLHFAPVPLAELLDRDYAARFATLSEGLETARYRPRVGAIVTRRIRSSPWSLLVPTALRAGASRPAERDLDASSTSYEMDVETLHVAPNLFGRLGSASLFDFYDTDELQQRAQLSFRGGDGAAWSGELSVDQEIRLVWTSGPEVTLETLVTLDLPAITRTRLTARLAAMRESPAEVAASIPLPARLRGLERTLEHESALELEYDGGEESLIIGRLEHSSTLRFRESGSIRLHGGLGVGSERVLDARILLLGVRIGIEGTLRL